MTASAYPTHLSIPTAKLDTGVPEHHSEILHAVLETTHEAILVLDARQFIVQFNTRFCELFDLERHHLLGQPLSAITAKLQAGFKNPAAGASAWNALMAGTSAAKPLDWEICHPTSRLLEARSKNIQPVPGLMLLTWKDVTELRQRQKAREQSHKLETLGRLTSGIAHDFNNLLTAISANLGMSIENLRQGKDQDVASMLADALKATGSGHTLIKQLLKHVRKSVDIRETLTVRNVYNDLCKLLKHSISPLVLVEIQLPKSLWNIEADAGGLQQVLLNLCVNAADAMQGQPKPHLVLSASNAEVSNGKEQFIRLQVKDNGRGIPEEILSMIFQPFFTTKGKGKGTGLGLATSKSVIEKMGGTITVESALGKGTTFTILIPRGHGTIAGVSASPPTPVTAKESRPCTEHILVVDDDMLVRNVSVRLLKREGYQVSCVSDGVEALEWINNPDNKADLVLMDVAMPRLSGPDALREIRKMKTSLPVIMCSGFPLDVASFRRKHGLTADASITKPFDIHELTDSVRRLLNEHLDAKKA